MAWDRPKGRPALFPTRLRLLMKDVRNLKKDHRHQGIHEEVAMPVDNSTTSASTSTTPIDTRRQPALSVDLTVKFEDPLDFSYSRSYHSSPDLDVSERLCRGLLRRVDHSCFELITRKDPTAASERRSGVAKTKRFEMTIEIKRDGFVWSKRTYKSYQKEPMTADGAKEVVLSTNRMVGLFLKRHDAGFVWKDGPVRDEPAKTPQTSPYRVGAIQPMNCVPRSLFIEDTQDFEVIPGYAVDLKLMTRSKRRKPPEWSQTIKVQSNQTTPLNLAVAESLFFDASYALEGVIRSRTKVIQEQHRRCGFIGGNCSHFEEDAFEVTLRVSNALGPQFDHLQRTTLSKIALLNEVQAKDSLMFIAALNNALSEVRDTADEALGEIDDLDFRIMELRGRGWSIEKPLVFTLGPSASYSRRSVEAILDRVQTGVAEILRKNAVSVRMCASKRGHFILDKTLVARQPKSISERFSTPSKTMEKVVNRLKRRIEEDIQMVTKDTCSLDTLDDDIRPSTRERLQDVASDSEPQSESTNELLDATIAAEALLSSPETAVAQSAKETSRPTTPRRPIELEASVDSNSTPRSRILAIRTDIEPVPGLPEEIPAMTPGGTITLVKAIRCPKTGARVFPLVPSIAAKSTSDLCHHDVAEQVEEKQLVGGTSPRSKSAPPLGDEAHAVLKSAPGGQLREESLVQESTPTPAAKALSAVEPQEELPFDRTEALPVSDPAVQQSGASKQDCGVDDVPVTPSTPSMEYEERSRESSLMLYTPNAPGGGANVEVVTQETSMSCSEDESSFDRALDRTVRQPLRKLAPSPLPTLSLVEPLVPPAHPHIIGSDDDQVVVAKSEKQALGKDRLERDQLMHVESKTDLSGSATQIPSERSFSQETEKPDVANREAMTPPLPEASAAAGVLELAPTKTTRDEKQEAAIEGEDQISNSGPQISKQTYPRLSVAEPTPPRPRPLRSSDDVGVVNRVASVYETDGGVSLQLPIYNEGAKVDEPHTPVDNKEDDHPDNFAQTAQEFDFDSPWPMSSPLGEDAVIPEDAISTTSSPRPEYAMMQIPRALTDADTRALSRFSLPPMGVPLRPAPPRARRKSQGSAGLLGFHEERLIEVGLRRALMGSPRSSFGSNDGMPLPMFRRPLHRLPAMELQLTRRPASSSGRELRPTGFTPQSPKLRAMAMKRSSSSSAALELSRVTQEVRPEDVVEGEGEAGDRSKATGLMFLFGAMTIASQMMKPASTR